MEAPSFDQLIWPTIQALKTLGGSGTIQELVEAISVDQGYPEDILSLISKDGRRTQVEYNSAWARTYLKKYGAITNTGKGVWVLLEKGEKLSPSDVPKVVSSFKNASRDQSSDLAEAANVDPQVQQWKSDLISTLTSIPPDAFERLCKLVLRESGFVKVEVTGKTGDGGIDGRGVLRINLLSFHVAFQSKRYVGSVGAPEIQKFRGAIMGRADKGLFITTGYFTQAARLEANRDSANAIDLIDGEELCDLLKTLKLGVQCKLVETVSIDRSWFRSI